MKATFFERLGSYLVDTIVVSLIFSLICLGYGNYTTDTEKRMGELDEQLMEKNITTEEYLEEYKDLFYDYQKENVLQSGISVALTIAYYVIFQYMNKGQTIGKKLLNIRIVDKDNEKPISILKGLFRSLLVFNIISGILGIIFIYVLGKNTYFNAYGIVAGIETLFVIATIMFILYRKDHRGLHDIITNTIVIRESR